MFQTKSYELSQYEMILKKSNLVDLRISIVTTRVIEMERCVCIGVCFVGEVIIIAGINYITVYKTVELY